jgi:hypothetical protein
MALVRTDVSEELGTSFIRVTRIGELGTTLAVTCNRRTLQRNTWNELFLSIYLILPGALDPEVYSASNRNEYQMQE